MAGRKVHKVTPVDRAYYAGATPLVEEEGELEDGTKFFGWRLAKEAAKPVAEPDKTGVAAFCALLSKIDQNDGNYLGREQWVMQAFAAAKELNYKPSVRADPTHPEWPIITIDLPKIGEVSWQHPDYEGFGLVALRRRYIKAFIDANSSSSSSSGEKPRQ